MKGNLYTQCVTSKLSPLVYSSHLAPWLRIHSPMSTSDVFPILVSDNERPINFNCHLLWCVAFWAVWWRVVAQLRLVIALSRYDAMPWLLFLVCRITWSLWWCNTILLKYFISLKWKWNGLSHQAHNKVTFKGIEDTRACASVSTFEDSAITL